jgi:hypothetical protein
LNGSIIVGGNLMKLALVGLVLAILLCGCMTREQQIAEQNAKDDQKCLSYGARPGSDAYVNCRAQLDGARTTASAIEDAAPPPAQPAPVRGPVTCMRTGTMVTCN